MKITSTLALTALLVTGANAQTVLYSQNFESVTMANTTPGSTSIGLFGVASSAGETSYTNAQTAALGIAGVSAGNVTVKGAAETVWNAGTSGVTTNSKVLAINTTVGTVNFLNLSLAAGHTLTVKFDTWGVFSDNDANTVSFAGNAMPTFLINQKNPVGMTTITRTFTNTTGSSMFGALAVTSNAGNMVLDNILVTVPEPSAALLGAFGALALLRRRRA